MSSGGGNTTSTVNQSNLPEYAKPYYQDLMKKAQEESKRPYQPYEGQRLAGQSAATQAGLGMASGFANSPTSYAQSGLAMLGSVGNAAAQLGTSYNPNAITNSYNGPVGGMYQAGQFGVGDIGWEGGQGMTGVTQVDAGGAFDEAALAQYSSPYMQAVVDKAKQDALLNYGEEATLRSGQAATAGAFGGSRAAVQEQMARNALQSNLTDIQVKGSQAAFENAQQQFERDRAARMQGQQANQSASLAALQGNQRAQQEAQAMLEQSRQFGFQGNQQAAQKAAELGMTAQQLTEQFRQSGMDLRLQGLGLAADTAQNRIQGQTALDAMMQNRIKAQLGVGQAQEDYKQQQLDTAYNDFVNQRDSQKQNLQFLSSILRGVPISANSDVQTTTPGNPLAGLLGSASGLAALQGLMQQQ